MRLPTSLKILLFSLIALTLGACTTTSTHDGLYHKGYYQNHPHTGNNELSHFGQTCFFCEEDPTLDADGDGVPDSMDKCPKTPENVKVNSTGCPLDSDGDGVYDYIDTCPGTLANIVVNMHGCALDSDGDGVEDSADNCPDTSASVEVDPQGCPLDSDGDGVIDSHDQCPGTPANVGVNSKGCPLDSDGDMVNDDIDRCPETTANVKVNSYGCWVINNLNFKSGKSKISYSSNSALNGLAATLISNPNLKVEIQGYTDNRGSNRLNTRLSQSRAQSVADYLSSQGVSSSRMIPKGYGPENPIADNSTSEGRAENRRVELKPIQ
jgi:OmpA-OmpF porin, OOP family